MKVSEIMHENPVCCLLTDTAQTAAQTMKENNAGALPVVEQGGGGKLLGIVTDRDLCMAVVASGRDPKSIKVEDCTTFRPVACRHYDHVTVAMRLMRENQVRRMPVVDAEGCIVGIVSLANLAPVVAAEPFAEMMQGIYVPVRPKDNRQRKTMREPTQSKRSKRDRDGIDEAEIAHLAGT